MIPSIALVGRANVGKSTLFNRLTCSRDSLVADFPGLTRDCIHGKGKLDSRAHLVMDTGGLWQRDSSMQQSMESMVMRIIEESDAVLMICDAQVGVTASDRDIANVLRRLSKRFFVLANKMDLARTPQSHVDFHELGIEQVFPVSALRRTGLQSMLSQVLSAVGAPHTSVEGDRKPVVALLGKPNVGKSTLMNTLSRQQRVLVSAEPGTTRDSVRVEIDRDEGYVLIDTAGVRRRDRSKGLIEKLSIVKTLQAVESASVVVLLLDAQDGVHDQDAQLAGLLSRSGRSVVVALNKWDGTSRAQRTQVLRAVDYHLGFFATYPKVPLSALHGSGLGELLDYVRRANQSANAQIQPRKATAILQEAMNKQKPPMYRGYHVQLKYAHQGGKQPPRIIIHGNRIDKVPDHYKRYLERQFASKMGLVATPVKVELRAGHNPYASKTTR